MKLVELNHSHKRQLLRYIKDYNKTGETTEGNIALLNFLSFDLFLHNMQHSWEIRTFLMMDNDKIVGTLDIRNQDLDSRNWLGDIGYSVHPKMRNKGYAKAALQQAIDLIEEKMIIITCYKDNYASRKVIEHCGGTLVSEFKYTEIPALRYEIHK